MTYSAEGVPEETLEQELGYVPRYWIQGYDSRASSIVEPSYIDRQVELTEAMRVAAQMSTTIPTISEVRIFSRRQHLLMATYIKGKLFPS